MSSHKVIKTHYDGGANVFALTDKSLFYIFKEANMPYTQASGGTDTVHGLGSTKIYPCPAYYVPDNPSSTFSPGALKYFIGFKVAQCDSLSHCNFTDPQGHNTVIRTEVDNFLDYLPIEVFMIPSDPKFKQSLTAVLASLVTKYPNLQLIHQCLAHASDEKIREMCAKQHLAEKIQMPSDAMSYLHSLQRYTFTTTESILRCPFGTWHMSSSGFYFFQ
eukprot:scaffold8800_cov58-Attheya_sp.AAC.3